MQKFNYGYIYLKCPKCGTYFMDMFGEFALTSDYNGDYGGPECGSVSYGVNDQASELMKQGIHFKNWDDYKDISKRYD